MYFKTSSFTTILLVFTSLSTSFPNPQSHPRAVSLPLPDHAIHKFPDPTWLENLAVRPDNTILASLGIPSASVYLVDPRDGSSTLVHTFSSVTGLAGIAALGHDTYYIAGANVSFATLTGVKGSVSIFELDMRSFNSKNGSGAQVKKVVDIPESVLPNGVTTLSSQEKTILVADSSLGVVFNVDVAARTYDIAVDIPELKPPAGAFPIGVNGIKIHDGWLYYTNTAQQTVGRVHIHRNGTVYGTVEVLATGVLPDDFAVDKEGRLWIAMNFRNQLSVLVPSSGNMVSVLGAEAQLTLPGPTSCAFGRRGLEEVLFVATSGGLASPINGTLTEGGKIVAVDTKGF
ncbi:hypothetical protein OIDMADRAFT_27698 [Oidiodendron maius Zn]|uniref:SMP-30/Gluconolactonase/LRE-like region domain-containing protein n=1 Tax=Oidiodendron maius (strain Zn) TaxID=913774 RepID=A0A0C3CW98_OIDMZ|nr:hypothetical protein OIDMADRAFT_27698 [Oidiodendron maius Zn]